jgi:hypothetical protein
MVPLPVPLAPELMVNQASRVDAAHPHDGVDAVTSI